MEQKRIFGVFFFVVLLLVFLQLVGIFQLFLQPILWATILSLVFYPLYFNLNRRLHHRSNLSALLVTCFVLVVTMVPLLFFSGTLTKELIHFYGSLGEWISGREYIPWLNWLIRSPLGELWRSLVERSASMNFELVPMLGKAAQKMTQLMAAQVQVLATNAFLVGAQFFLTIIILFFFLRDGESMGRALKDLFPMSAENKEAVFSKLAITVSAVVQGLVVTGAVQGLLAGLAFWVLGVPYPVFLALLVAFIALVPIGGAVLVWLPCCAYLGLTDHWIKAIILFAWGALVISMVDNFLKPLLIGEKTNLPTLFLLLSILGGLAFYGFIGIFLGPVMLGLFMSLIEIYRKEYHRSLDA